MDRNDVAHIDEMTRSLGGVPDLNPIRRRNHQLFHHGYVDGAGVYHPPRLDPACLICTGVIAP